MSEIELISLKISPYSLATRWMLYHCGIQYKLTHYEPILGELGLRLRLLWWKYSAWKVTVPILLTKSTVYPSSFDIAIYAHERSPDAHLMDDIQLIRPWNDRFQFMLSYFRSVLMTAVQSNSELILEFAPPPLRRFPRIARFVSSTGVALFTWKYKKESTATDATRVQEVLGLIQETIGKQPYLLGDSFTYADLLMAVAVDHLSPGPHSTIQGIRKDIILGLKLAAGFEDVVAWKESIYERHYKE